MVNCYVPAGSELFELAYYRWIHGVIAALIVEASAPAERSANADCNAHVLLGFLRMDLTDHLLESNLMTVADPLEAQTALIHAVVGAGGHS